MSEKTYVSTSNYYPGTTQIPAGSVFTEDQWCECGGKASSLQEHLKKGYITENVQYVPEKVVDTEALKQAPDVVEDPAPSADSTKEKAQGIWNYSVEELQDLDIGMLNTIYKDRSAEYGIKVNRPFTNKENLIAKMTSENNKD